MVISQIALAQTLGTSKGYITILRSPNYESNTIYFKMNPMPSGVTQWLYLRGDSNTRAGCSVKGTLYTLNRTFSLLTTAKATGAEVSVHYCIDSNGYGLIRYVELL